MEELWQVRHCPSTASRTSNPVQPPWRHSLAAEGCYHGTERIQMITLFAASSSVIAAMYHNDNGQLFYIFLA